MILLLAASCGKQPSTMKEYFEWLNDPANRLVQERKVNGYKLTMKFLPAEYLAYKDMKDEGLGMDAKDSILSLYEKNLTFLLTVGPDEESGNKADVMMSDIGSKEEYTDRVMAMNFVMEDMITLQAGDEKIRPVLSNMENTYGLGKSRSLMIVFAPANKPSGPAYDLAYADELFGTGILHFVFDTERINNIPGIPSWN
jgi:hypothetical protein